VDSSQKEIRRYETASGKVPFSDWVDGLGDKKTQGIIVRRVDRLEAGNFGDCGPVGEGVQELVVDYGPGYRVYFGVDGDFVILLCGGDKSTQNKNIKTARGYWKDYNA
jgi:putative addiction module killer protein